VLDSSVDLIARATRRPEHDDYVLTRRPPTSKLEEQRMMMFRIRELEQRMAPDGGNPGTPQSNGADSHVVRHCSDPLSMFFAFALRDSPH